MDIDPQRLLTMSGIANVCVDDIVQNLFTKKRRLKGKNPRSDVENLNERHSIIDYCERPKKTMRKNLDIELLERDTCSALTSIERKKMSSKTEIINHEVNEDVIGESTKQRWNRLCRTELPSISIVFDPAVVRCCLPDSMMGSITHLFHPGVNNLCHSEMIDLTLSGIASIRFSKPPGSSKAVWLSTEGNGHVEFRTRIVSRVVQSVFANPESALPENSEVPDWVASKSITEDDINFVKTRTFDKVQRLRRRHRGKHPLKRDIGVFAADFVYKQVGKVLVNCRRRMDAAFFQQVGYTMTDWNEFTVRCGGKTTKIDQSTLEFVFPVAYTVFTRVLDKVPLCSVQRPTSDVKLVDDENMQNYEVARKFLSSYVLKITHEVVFDNNGKLEKEKRTKNINFFSLAFRLLGTFGCTSERLMLIRNSRFSLKVVAILAYALYCLTVSYAKKYSNQNSSNHVSVEDIAIGNLRLESLFPCKHRMCEIASTSSCFVIRK